MGRGRPRKPTSLHIVEETLDPSKHADRAFEPLADGTPRCPRDLKGEARKFWERVVPQLVRMGVAKAADRESLVVLANLWACWVQAATMAEIAATDPKVRSAMLGYSAEWSRLAARFGLTPADRSKIQATPQVKEKTLEDRYFG
jgi:phage terminase small subunit